MSEPQWALSIAPWLPALTAAEWASWVQAIGSIVAIIASAILAVSVPLYLQRLHDRAMCQRAINSAAVAGGLAMTAWALLVKILEDRAFTQHSPAIIGGPVLGARTAAALVPHSLMLGVAFEAMTQISSSMDLLDQVMKRLQAAPDPYALISAISFQEQPDELGESNKKIESLEPRKVAGHWMLWSRQEDLPAGTRVTS